MIVSLLDFQLPMQSMPITTNIVSTNLVHGEVYSIQHCVIKIVSGLLPVSSINKIDRHDIIELLLKVALNTITLNITLTHFSALYNN